jgi:cystathionine gamma-synthase
MRAFEHIPLGTPIPDSPHAVSCSLPTMASVRGYEEKLPEVTEKLRAGYPRFVLHPFSRRLAGVLSARHGLGGRTLWLTSSLAMAEGLVGHLASRGASLFSEGGIHGASHPVSPEAYLRAKLYLQNIGGFISSREAEDRLAELGEAAPAASGAAPAGDPVAEVLRVLGPFVGAAPADLCLASCGMNAVHAAFQAVNRLQAPKGRTGWVQLGWLYLDTIAILRKFTASPGDYHYVSEVVDPGPLERLLAEHGSRIAGVMAEVPTNPLVQMPDVERLAALCRRHGVKLVLDPSVASVFNVDCLAHADILVASLTKYSGHGGDLIAGLAAVNPAGPDAAFLRSQLAASVERPYRRDLERLAEQVGTADGVVRRINANTAEVAAFLASHPGVARIHWSLAPGSRANYLKVARSAGASGGVISFELKGPLEAFYDRLRLPKGPSFGMTTTLICPFMYLAHYDLVSTAGGREELRRNGLDPDLLRLSVGTEPTSGIVAALAEALGPA